MTIDTVIEMMSNLNGPLRFDPSRESVEFLSVYTVDVKGGVIINVPPLR